MLKALMAKSQEINYYIIVIKFSAIKGSNPKCHQTSSFYLLVRF